MLMESGNEVGDNTALLGIILTRLVFDEGPTATL